MVVQMPQGWGVGGGRLQWVWFFSLFGLKMGIDFNHSGLK